MLTQPTNLSHSIIITLINIIYYTFLVIAYFLNDDIYFLICECLNGNYNASISVLIREFLNDNYILVQLVWGYHNRRILLHRVYISGDIPTQFPCQLFIIHHALFNSLGVIMSRIAEMTTTAMPMDDSKRRIDSELAYGRCRPAALGSGSIPVRCQLGDVGQARGNIGSRNIGLNYAKMTPRPDFLFLPLVTLLYLVLWLWHQRSQFWCCSTSHL